MKLSPSQMKTVRHQFDSIYRKVLRDESRNYKKQLARRADKEINLSELSEAELGQLYAMDEYPSDSTFFDVLEYRVAVKDDRLAEALAALPSKKRDVILLSYFLDMTDTEIAEKLKVVGSTIHRRRTSSLEELKLSLRRKLPKRRGRAKRCPFFLKQNALRGWPCFAGCAGRFFIFLFLPGQMLLSACSKHPPQFCTASEKDAQAELT